MEKGRARLMTNVVIDASVIVSWFLPDETNGKYDDILNRMDKIKINVPSIFEYELMNIIINATKKKRIDFSTALQIFDIVWRYPIVVESPIKTRVFEIAHAQDLTAYDAAYLELAMRLHVPLITYDKVLLNAAKKVKIKTAL